MILSAGDYIAKPLQLTFNNMNEMSAAAWKAQIIVKRCAAHEAFFSDYMRGCDKQCGGLCRSLSPSCSLAQKAVVSTLTKPDAMLWEVWDDQELDLVGILRLSEVVLGCSAKAHYFFFDGKLRDKTELLLEWKRWVFEEAGLHRVTIEVPAHAHALARHAERDLGFEMEGTMRKAIKWHGVWHDIYIMGCVNGN